MRRLKEIGIPNFLEKPAPLYSPVGRAARAVFLKNVADAWQSAGDQDTAAKIRRDADSQVKRVGGTVRQVSAEPAR